MAQMVKLTRGNGKAVFVNMDNVLYFHGESGDFGEPYTRLVFAPGGQGGAWVCVTETLKQVADAAGVPW